MNTAQHKPKKEKERGQREYVLNQMLRKVPYFIPLLITDSLLESFTPISVHTGEES